MAETKDDITAERDALRAENERLRAQIAAASVATVPAPKPFLTEAERQDLVTFGVTTDVHTGRRLNLHQAAELYPGVHLEDATDAARAAADKDNQE